MKFLCEHHRRQLIGQPDLALDHWRQWMDKSSTLMENSDWRPACNLLGCGFELAEWLLDNPQPGQGETLDPVNRYMVTGHQLAECLGRSGRGDLELHFLLTVHLRLIDWVKSRRNNFWLLQQHLRISLAMLSRYRRRRGSFKGFYDCCAETEWYIKLCVN